MLLGAWTQQCKSSRRITDRVDSIDLKSCRCRHCHRRCYSHDDHYHTLKVGVSAVVVVVGIGIVVVVVVVVVVLLHVVNDVGRVCDVDESVETMTTMIRTASLDWNEAYDLGECEFSTLFFSLHFEGVSSEKFSPPSPPCFGFLFLFLLLARRMNEMRASRAEPSRAEPSDCTLADCMNWECAPERLNKCESAAGSCIAHVVGGNIKLAGQEPSFLIL